MLDYKLTNIDWLKKGVIAVQEIEHFVQIRKGLTTRESMQNFVREHLPERAARLNELGVELAVMGSFNSVGYGLDNEAMTYEKVLAEALHKNGIRVGAYVETVGAFAYEGVAVEEPSCLEWAQRDHQGNKPTYYSQYNRYIPCINHEDYLQYIEKGLKYAVDSLKADLVFFDNFGYYSYSCSCDHCKKAFREYLNNKYPTRREKIDRLGFPSVEGINPPVFQDNFEQDFTDPFLFVFLYDSGIVYDTLQQEWIDFRCKRLGNIAKRINNYLKGINPDIATVWNVPYMGPMGYINNALFHGIWPTEVYPHCDAFSAEADQGMLGLQEDGRLLTRIRTFKNARKLNKGVWMTNFRQTGIELDLAESIAYSPFLYNTIGSTGLDFVKPETQKYMDFFKKNREYFIETKEMSEIGLLNSYASLSYQTISPLKSLIYMEEVLIRSKIPYSVVFDEDLEDISRYSVLILPNVKYLSEKQLAQIEKYVRDGGCIVATEQTSIFDEWGRRYKGISLLPTPIEEQEYGLEKVLGIKWPLEETVKGTLGKGKFAVIPKIEQHKEKLDYKKESHSIGPWVPYLKCLQGYLPANREHIQEVIDWAREGKEIVTVSAPESVTMEFLQQDRNNRLLMNFVNYDSKNSVRDIKVMLKTGSSMKISRVEYLMPENESVIGLEYRNDAGKLSFCIPELQVIGVVAINY